MPNIQGYLKYGYPLLCDSVSKYSSKLSPAVTTDDCCVHVVIMHIKQMWQFIWHLQHDGLSRGPSQKH